MSEEFNLPGSSLKEVQKIIMGYSQSTDNVSLDSLAKLTGLHRTKISRNNKFLTDLGLISGGVKKSPTELGRKLGRALEHNQENDIRKYWSEAVQTNQTVSSLVTTVRIKGGMTEGDFSDHVLYVSGQKNHSGNRAGARCVVDVLVEAELLDEENGKLAVSSPTVQNGGGGSDEEPETPGELLSGGSEELADQAGSRAESNSGALIPQIAINIQLHLPETDNADVYEKLFCALREQLISPKE